MPYWLESDTFADDPVWEVLADGKADRIDALQAAYARLKAKASHLLSDGYLTEQTALLYCRGRRPVLDKLTTAVLGRPPLLHRRGDECECLGEEWTDGYSFRIHNFLKRNPSRREYNRNQAQRRDLADPRLKAQTYARDGGCCRYCRSGPLSAKAVRSRDRRKVLQYDHIDPDAPAGPDGAGLVVACGRCNEHKGRRTPDEADMVLLPEPTAAEAAAWRARGLALFDMPPYPGPAGLGSADDQPTITGESTVDHRSDQKPITDRVSDPIADPSTDRNADHTPAVYPEQRHQQAEQRSDQRREGSGTGRVGTPRSDPTATWRDQPPRSPQHPDVYHRRSRAPATPPPDPGYVWPPGSVPATRRPADPSPDPEEYPSP